MLRNHVMCVCHQEDPGDNGKSIHACLGMGSSSLLHAGWSVFSTQSNTLIHILLISHYKTILLPARLVVRHIPITIPQARILRLRFGLFPLCHPKPLFAPRSRALHVTPLLNNDLPTPIRISRFDMAPAKDTPAGQPVVTMEKVRCWDSRDAAGPFKRAVAVVQSYFLRPRWQCPEMP